MLNFLEFAKKFPDEKAVIDHFIKVRFKADKPHCTKCGCVDRIVKEKDRPKVFHCNNCEGSFSIFKDTIFEKSKTDLVKWMYAIRLFLNGKKGISGYQLQREIGVTYKTAWRMLKQIRLAMGNVDKPDFFQTIIEIDETYVGGKPRKGNKRNGDEKSKRGRGTKKTPVVGVLDRNTKRVHAKVALPDGDGRTLTGKQLLDILREVSRGTNTIMTDEFSSYNILKKTNHHHFTIDHSKAYADGAIHTNGIENFWGNVKRGILGIYHQVSKKYLQSYIDEYVFRYNNAKNVNEFDTLLGQCVLQSSPPKPFKADGLKPNSDFDFALAA